MYTKCAQVVVQSTWSIGLEKICAMYNTHIHNAAREAKQASYANFSRSHMHILSY